MSPLPIVDSHVHLWNPTQLRYEWLDDLPTLNHSFSPADYATAYAGANVSKFIFVEGGRDPKQNLAEMDWVAELAKSEPRLQGIIAHACLQKGKTIRDDLEKLAQCSLVKGIRRNLQSETDPDFCLNHEFIVGIQLLAEFDFTFDICIRHEQLRKVTELVRRAPQVTFVLDHFGKPDVRNRQVQPWAGEIKVLAALPNIACKISGLTTEADWETWQPEDLKFYFDWAIECFGPDRVLFGSDWPVATLATNYSRWIETVQQCVSSLSESDQIKLFKANAERIYRV